MPKRFVAKLKLESSLAPLCGFAAFVILLPFSRLDPDLHHDGLMSTGAIAIRDGLIPHRDFFAQYGPVVPIVQSIPLFFGLPGVFGIRLLNAALIAGSIGLLIDLPRIAPSSAGINRRAAVLASFTWLILADVFSGVPMLPWTSVLATFQVVLTIWLLLRSVESSDQVTTFRPTFLVLAGLVTSSIFFTRITVGAVFVIMTVIVALALMIRKGTTDVSRAGKIFLSAVIGGFLVSLSMLILTGAISSWFEQSIAWPSRWRHSANQNYRPTDVILSSTSNVFLEVALLILIGALWGLHRTTRCERDANDRFEWLLTITTTILGLWLLVRIYGSPTRTPGLFFAAVELGVDANSRGRQNLTFLFTLVVSGVFVSTLIVMMSVGKNRVRDIRVEPWGMLLVAIGALATTSQIWPVPDSRHIWWGALLPIFVILSFLTRNPRSLRFDRIVLVAPLIFASMVSYGNGKKYLDLPRTEFKEQSSLDSMLVGYGVTGIQDVSRIRRTIELLKNLKTEYETAVFLVEDGFWAGFDGSFFSGDSSYVNWGDVGDLETRLSDTELVLVSEVLVPRYSDQLQNAGFQAVQSGASLVIPYVKFR